MCRVKVILTNKSKCLSLLTTKRLTFLSQNDGLIKYKELSYWVNSSMKRMPRSYYTIKKEDGAKTMEWLKLKKDSI